MDPLGDSARKAIVDIIFVGVVFVVVRAALVLVGFLLPGPPAVLAGLGAATWRLHGSGVRWRDLGLRKPTRWWWLVPLNLLLIIATALIVNLVLQPFFERHALPSPSTDAFGFVQGNLPALIACLVFLAWGTAAFGEEMLIRGFLLTRLNDFFGASRVATLLALVVHAMLFGLAHFAHGIRGIIMSTTVGFLMGLAYLAAGRSLWATIPAHGIIDTISLVQTYQS